MILPFMANLEIVRLQKNKLQILKEELKVITIKYAKRARAGRVPQRKLSTLKPNCGRAGRQPSAKPYHAIRRYLFRNSTINSPAANSQNRHSVR